MARNVRNYSHVCPVARALEQVGERWSLLVVRDLLTGPRRFTDLMDRLGGITPATLSQRLRTLEGAGLLTADRQAGRREVWYQLTDAGQDLAPVIDTLGWWGWRHAWKPPALDDVIHVEHMLRAITQVLNHTAPDGDPAQWHFNVVDDGRYTVRSDGTSWSLHSSALRGTPESVVVTTDSRTWRRFIHNPTVAHAAELGIELQGSPAAVRRLLRVLRTFRDSADQPRATRVQM